MTSLISANLRGTLDRLLPLVLYTPGAGLINLEIARIHRRNEC